MLVEGHLVEWLILAKCVTLLNIVQIKNKKNIKNRLGEAVLTNTYNLCFEQKYEK